MKVAQPGLTLYDPMDCPWDSPGQNTAVGSLFLLQGIFPTQELNRGLLHCRRILYQLSYQGSPIQEMFGVTLEWDRKPPNSSQKRHYLTCFKRSTLATVFRLKGNMVKGRETGEKAMKILTRDHSDLDQGKNRSSENLLDCGYILKAEAKKFSDIDYEGN